MSPETKQNQDDQPFLLQEEEIDYEEYMDDEPVRKPKTGKSLRKFRHPADR